MSQDDMFKYIVGISLGIVVAMVAVLTIGSREPPKVLKDTPPGSWVEETSIKYKVVSHLSIETEHGLMGDYQVTNVLHQTSEPVSTNVAYRKIPQ